MLPKRLQACADFVRQGTRVCDVGTDHALLPCELVKQGKATAALAADVHEKPLAGARKTIRASGCADRVTTRLSDGLQQILPEEADDVVIAGMGGELMARIVLECDWLRTDTKRLILQPMTQAPLLRQALAQNGFRVLEERAVWENGHSYTVLWAAYDGVSRTLTLAESWAGAHQNHPVGESARYLKIQQSRAQKIARGLFQAGDPNAQKMQDLADALGNGIEEEEA